MNQISGKEGFGIPMKVLCSCWESNRYIGIESERRTMLRRIRRKRRRTSPAALPPTAAAAAASTAASASSTAPAALADGPPVGHPLVEITAQDPAAPDRGGWCHPAGGTVRVPAAQIRHQAPQRLQLVQWKLFQEAHRLLSSLISLLSGIFPLLNANFGFLATPPSPASPPSLFLC